MDERRHPWKIAAALFVGSLLSGAAITHFIGNRAAPPKREIKTDVIKVAQRQPKNAMVDFFAL